ncbi:unnamed protein product [Lupinus luteus]|uniref:Uncharacterized protein n=1 Tax=Lupinus luteus TaxID=3873 RepID=A0AAV1X5W7_LUPLU
MRGKGPCVPLFFLWSETSNEKLNSPFLSLYVPSIFPSFCSIQNMIYDRTLWLRSINVVDTIYWNKGLVVVVVQSKHTDRLVIKIGDSVLDHTHVLYLKFF